MKWLAVCPAVLWFGFYAATLERFPGFAGSVGEVSLIFGVLLALYALSWTGLIEIFTQGGMFAGGRVVQAASAEEESCVAFLLRLALCGAVYAIPLRIFFS